MKKIALVIGKLSIGFIISLLYIKFLFSKDIFEVYFLGGSRNMGFFLPALFSGPLLVFLLTSRTKNILAFILLLLMVTFPSIDLYNQAVIEAKDDRIYQEEKRKQAEGEQAALWMIKQVYSGEISSYKFDGGPWGACTTILTRIEGNHGIAYYDYDIEQNRIVGLITEESFIDAVQQNIKGASKIHIIEDDFGSIDFTYKVQGKEKKAAANISYSCQQLSMNSILLIDQDRKLMPSIYDFVYMGK